MSRRLDGSYCCDRCGTDVGNAGVQEAASISDLDPADPTRIRQLHLCLDRPDPAAPGKTIQGCRGRVLTRKALANYHETRTPPA